MGQKLRHLWPTEQEFIRCIIQLGQRGINIDLDKCKEMESHATIEMLDIVERLNFNPGSTKELGNILLEELNLPVVLKTKAGNPSFNKAAMAEYDIMLDAMGNPLAQDILKYRGWQQSNSFYYHGYQKMVSPDGRVRPNYKVTGTRTGRLSCEQPNLQQIPRVSDKEWSSPVKSLFIPTDNSFVLWDFDYSSLEYRIALLYASIFGSETTLELIRRVNNGEDFHQVTADLIYEKTGVQLTRYDAKQMNFAIVYGAGAEKLAYMLKTTRDKSTGTASPEKVKELMNAYNESFPDFRPASWRAQGIAKERGYIKYWTGRRRHFNTYWNRNQSHKAFNSACQGGGAEIVKHAMIKCMKKIDNPQCKMLLQVHDSLMWEIKKDKLDYYRPLIKECMEDFQFNIKFAVEDKQWAT